MSFKRKYFFFDIDGTLAIGNPGRYIPESTKNAIEQLKAKGHFCAIATGRSYAMAIDYCNEIGFDNMVSDGGNGITINNKLIDIKPLDKQKCIQLIEECEQKGFAWGVSPDNSASRLTTSQRFIDETNDYYMNTIVDENLDIYSFENIYKVYVACFEGQENQLDLLKQLPFARYHKEYIFVEPDDKSIGIKMIMDYFNAPYEDVVVFGDAKNDLKMFRDEWVSIAMGNAIDELKEKASFVTKDADKDGIEYALKHYGWID